MSIKYQVLQRQDPRDRSVPSKFYAALTKRYEITFDELLNEIIDISTVSIGDTYNVLQTLIHLIKKHLQEGRTLKVGDLGTFYVTINSDGKDSDQEVDSNSIKKANIRFRPSVKLKDAMNRLKFNRIDENGAPPGGE
jgi:predicted histone-like DNA-binding protein